VITLSLVMVTTESGIYLQFSQWISFFFMFYVKIVNKSHILNIMSCVKMSIGLDGRRERNLRVWWRKEHNLRNNNTKKSREREVKN